MLHQARPLWLVTQEEQVLAKQLKAMQREVSKSTTVTGRNLFFRDFRASVVHVSPSKLSQEEGRTVLSQHGLAWSRLPAATRRGYEEEAHRVAALRKQSSRENVEALRSQRQLQEKRQTEHALVFGGICRLSNCNFNKDNIPLLVDIFAKISKNSALFSSLADVVPSPLPPTRGELEKLQQASTAAFLPETSGTTPEWAKTICRLRDSFYQVVVACEQEGELCFWMVLHASQNPLNLRLAPLRAMRQTGLLGVDAMDRVLEVCSENYLFLWASSLQTVNAAVLPDKEAADWQVILSCKALGHERWCSDQQPQPLASYVARLQQGDAPRRQGQREPRPDARLPAVLEQHPWLQTFLQRRGAPAAPQMATQGQDSSEEEAPQQLAQETLDAAYASLLDKRKAWNEVLERNDFLVELRGGKWTMSRRGAAWDAVSTKPARSEVAEWCAANGLPKQGSWSVLKYGERNATMMARAWQHKMQAIYTFMKIEGMDLPNALLAYREEADFTEWVTTVPEQDPVLGRVTQLRHLGQPSGAARGSRD